MAVRLPGLGTRMGMFLGTSESDGNQTENMQKALEPKNGFGTDFLIQDKKCNKGNQSLLS